MKTFVYDGNPKNLSKIIADKLPLISFSYLQKIFRKNDIRLNGKKIGKDCIVQTGDEITVYYKEELLTVFEPHILYEDENIAAIYKKQGIASQGEGSFESLVKQNLGENFRLCHRLDTNTAGLLLFAKSDEAEQAIKKASSDDEIEKTYYAMVFGELNESRLLIAYLKKDSQNAKVYIYDKPAPQAQRIVTKVSPVKSFDGCSLLEVGLVRGKTHQIRAHLAHIGLPVIGDSKYGREEINTRFSKKKQQLLAYKIRFNITQGKLGYLKNKEITLPNPLSFFDIL